MDPAPPPPLEIPSSTSSAAAAASSPSSSLGLPLGSIYSQSQRLSSLHPPLPPNRLSSFAGSGSSSSSFRPQFPSPAVGSVWARRGTRSGHALDDLYMELCSIRRTSVEYLARLDELAAEAKRARAASTSSSHPRMQTREPQQLRHHLARPSSSTMTFSGGPPPPPLRGTFSRHNTPSTSRFHYRARPSQATASLLPALPRGTFSRHSTLSPSRSQQQAWPPSQNTASLLPRGGFCTPSSSSWHQAQRPSSTSGLPDLTGRSSSVCAPWLSSSTSGSGRLDLMPNRNIISAEYSTSFRPQLQQACPSSSTTRLPYLPGASFASGYNAPSSSQQHQHAGPSSPTSLTSAQPNLTNGPVFGNAPSLSPQAHHASGSSSTMASGLPPLPESFISALPQPPSRAARNSGGLATFSAESSSWSAGTPPSSSNDTTSAGTGFVQPGSSSGQYELPPLPPSLPQMTLLPVKQEPVIDSSSVRLEPELIDIDDDTTDDLDTLLASLESCPGLMASLDSSPPLLHSSSSGNMQQQLQMGGNIDDLMMMSSSDQQSSPQIGDTPQQFMQPAWASELPPLPPSLDDTGGILPVGHSTSSARDVLQCESINWNAASTGSSGKNSEAMQGDPTSGSNSGGPITMPTTMLDGMESQKAPGASSSMSSAGANGNLFTDAEMEKVMTDKRLKEIMSIHPKRVKRILNNRACTAKLSAQKKKCIRDLERKHDALEVDSLSLSSRVESEQAKFVELNNEKKPSWE